MYMCVVRIWIILRVCAQVEIDDIQAGRSFAVSEGNGMYVDTHPTK